METCSNREANKPMIKISFEQIWGGFECDLSFGIYKWIIINLSGCDSGIVVIQINKYPYLLEMHTKYSLEIKYLKFLKNTPRKNIIGD